MTPREVFPAREVWATEFREGWLDHVQTTGDVDWSLYPKTPTLDPIVSSGLDLSRARVLLVSSSGAYRPGGHPAFDAASPLGDYTARVHATEQGLNGLAFAHDHYDHSAVEEDPGVLLPLPFLEEAARGDRVGSLADSWVSFMGYQPDLTRVQDETLPQVLASARTEHADAALLVPS